MPTTAIEIHYTMPSKSDPLVVQPLKVPKSVLTTFQTMASLEGRPITWMLRNELTGAAKKFDKIIAERIGSTKKKSASKK